jgi:hypothetical protein
VKVLVDTEELKKIEAELGQLKRVGKQELKWLVPPEWAETAFEGVLVELPEDRAAAVFRDFKVKTLRKKC